MPFLREAAAQPMITALIQAVRRLRPSNFIFLLVLPGVIYLFATATNYRRAFDFIIPGIWMTIFVAIGAYITSATLGLIFAGLLSLKRGKRTIAIFLGVTALLGAGSAVYFARPHDEFALAGDLESRVAIIKGTPQRLTDRIRFGTFEGSDGQETSIRSVTDLEGALELLERGSVSAIFVPADELPDDLPVLWRVSFLPDRFLIPGILLLSLAVFMLLLVIGSWQSRLHPLAVFAELYIDLVRGIPMLVIILFVGFPIAKAINDSLGIRLSDFVRGIAALSIGYSAYMAEIFRAGIEAIPKGQTEAARSLGLNGWQTARYVILPQAIKIVIPPLGNEFIAMLKDTALLSVLSIRELTQRTREFQSNTFILFPTFNTVAVIYIFLTLGAASFVKWVERRTDTG